MITFKRGTVWWVDLGDCEDHITGKVRPCVVVSNDPNNIFSPKVNVLPLTTQNDDLPQHLLLKLNGKDNYTLPEDIRPIGKSKFREYMGILSDEEMKLVEHSVLLQFGLVKIPYKIEVKNENEQENVEVKKVETGVEKPKFDIREIVKKYTEMVDNKDKEGLKKMADELCGGNYSALSKKIYYYKKVLNK